MLKAFGSSNYLSAFSVFFDHNVGASMNLSELRTIKRCQNFVRAMTLGNKVLGQVHRGQACNVTEKQTKRKNLIIYQYK